MEIERAELANKLIAAKGSPFIKIITGIRHCGKNYLLFNIFKRHLLESGVPKDHIIEVNLEHPVVADLVNPIRLLCADNKGAEATNPHLCGLPRKGLEPRTVTVSPVL